MTSLLDTFSAKLHADPDIQKMAASTKKTYRRICRDILQGRIEFPQSYTSQVRSVYLYMEEYGVLPEGFQKPESLFPNTRKRRKGGKVRLRLSSEKKLTWEEAQELIELFPTDERGQELRCLCRLSLYFGTRLQESLATLPGRLHVRDDLLLLHLPESLTKGQNERDAECLTNFDKTLPPFDRQCAGPFSIGKDYVQYEFLKARKVFKARQASRVSQVVTFHTLRHSYATHAVTHDADIRRVSQSLGHYSIDFTMQRYVHEGLRPRHYL